jgi:hypothetical protein
VAKFLKELGIFWSYEKPVYVWDKNERPRVWTPDFFLTQFCIYVEVCGSEKFDYEYRKLTYKENGYNVIFLHLFKDANKWKYHFLNYLKGISYYRNEKLEKIIEKALKN